MLVYDQDGSRGWIFECNASASGFPSLPTVRVKKPSRDRRPCTDTHTFVCDENYLNPVLAQPQRYFLFKRRNNPS